MSEPKGIGYSKLWMLPDSHPFYAAACWHDQQYDLRKAGKLKQRSSRQADLGFYRRCQSAALGDKSLLLQAKLFYGIVRAWGFIRWPDPDFSDSV